MKGVWCLFVARGVTRLAAVQIHFEGGAKRDYLICHRPAHGGRGATVPAHTVCRSLATLHTADTLDLRNRAHGERLEKWLLTLPLS